jgi:hypothetical protein
MHICVTKAYGESKHVMCKFYIQSIFIPRSFWTAQDVVLDLYKGGNPHLVPRSWMSVAGLLNFTREVREWDLGLPAILAEGFHGFCHFI